DAEILQHEKSRPACACRDKQIGAGIGVAQRASAGAAHAEIFPLPKRELARAVGQEVIETSRQNDLITPRLPGDPAVHLEIIRCRSDHIRYRVDDIAASIAVEVDRVALE